MPEDGNVPAASQAQRAEAPSQTADGALGVSGNPTAASRPQMREAAGYAAAASLQVKCDFLASCLLEMHHTSRTPDAHLLFAVLQSATNGCCWRLCMLVKLWVFILT